MKATYVLDGDEFQTLEEFYERIGELLIPHSEWGRNLDAFNDILRGGLGTPEGGFVIRWINSQRSSANLGYPETIRWLEGILRSCHRANRASVERALDDARAGRGKTLYDRIVEIIRSHGLENQTDASGVQLILE